MSDDVVVDPSPFDLAPSAEGGAAAGPGRAPSAVLCIHGLTGTPWEMRSIGEALAARGLRARGPVLPGHDATPEVLSTLSYREWIAYVRRELRHLQRDHEHVYVAGLSLGGLLTLLLGSEERVAGLAAVGTPIRFGAPKSLAIAVGRVARPMLPKRSGSDIANAAARARHPGMPAMPLASVHELVKLQKLVRAQLARVRAPLFVGHGSLDRTARPADAKWIDSRAGSPERRLRYYERSGHVVPVDNDAAEVAADIAEFFTRER